MVDLARLRTQGFLVVLVWNADVGGITSAGSDAPGDVLARRNPIGLIVRLRFPISLLFAGTSLKSRGDLVQTPGPSC